MWIIFYEIKDDWKNFNKNGLVFPGCRHKCKYFSGVFFIQEKTSANLLKFEL